MAEEQEHQQAEEKLKVELPGLFGGRKRRKQRSTPTEDEPSEPRQPFEDQADEPAPEERYDDVEEPPAPAPVSRFTPPAAATGSSEPDVEQTRRLPADVDSTTEEATTRDTTTEATGSTAEGAASSAEQRAEAAKPEKPEKPRKVLKPQPPLMVATAVGLFVGVLACGLTYAGMIGCQAIQGTTACGGPGFFVLMAIMVVLVVVGSFLLKTFDVADPTSTSLLATGLVAVIALTFLIEVIFAWWMIIVIPLVSAAAYAGSHWLTHVFTSTDLEG